MIQTDLTEVLKSYCEWDDIVKERYLRYAEELIQRHKVVLKSDCMSCIVELDRWSEWSRSEELIRNSAISVIIVHPLTYLLEQEIATKHSYPFPIYTDSNSEFSVMNDLDILESERLLILDNDFHIVFLGSPLTFPELKNAFLTFIDR